MHSSQSGENIEEIYETYCCYLDIQSTC